ncbi:MAG: hypothetical protein IKZ48_03780 [Prevotella sp.]|nr:hypothetical protein [Prevotella sp.]
MKKNFIYLALVACVAMCNVSCGDDDDKSSSEPQKTDNVTLTTPKYEDKAVEISITPEVASTFEYSGANYEKLSDEAKATLPILTNIDLTEGGQAVFEFTSTANGKTTKQYRTYPVESVKDDVYTLAGNRGWLKIEGITRAGSARITFSITIEFVETGVEVVLSTANGGGEAALVNYILAVAAAQGSLTEYLCRTWNVTGMILDLEGDVNTFKEFTGGNMAQVRDEAISHGAEFTDSEKAAFSKVINSVVVTKTGQLYINYGNTTVDACDWGWISQEEGTFRINLKDSAMGNKFLNDESVVDVNFKTDRLVLKLSTKITGNKTYNCALSLQLQASK